MPTLGEVLDAAATVLVVAAAHVRQQSRDSRRQTRLEIRLRRNAAAIADLSRRLASLERRR